MRQPLRRSGISATTATHTGQNMPCAPEASQITVQSTNGPSAPPLC